MKAHILVVDDNPVNLKLACELLKMEGYQVDQAEDAEKALVVIGKTQFDLVLMDIELPGMDGLTLTRLLKENPATQQIPVVALTSYAMKGDDEKAYQAGCVGYLTKPIDTRKFPGQIAAFINESASNEGKNSMKILVVDDEPRSLKLAHAVLASEGYEVSAADSAQAALDQIRTDKPDLILLDLVLPDMDGLALIRLLKSDPETCEVHIIAITAFPDRFTQDAAIQAGAAAYVMKPLDTRNISGLVNKIAKEKVCRTWCSLRPDHDHPHR